MCAESIAAFYSSIAGTIAGMKNKTELESE
jgi:hypothetical protein